MPSHERPTGGEHREKQPLLYCQAAQFSGEEPAGIAYFQAQDLIFRRHEDCDLSTFRLQLDTVWHVAVLGQPPPPDLDHQLSTILSAGEPASLSSEVIKVLSERRARATKRAPWLERHYRPGKRI